MLEVPVERLLERLRKDNPWWSEPHEIPHHVARWAPRPYLGLLMPHVRDHTVRRAVVLMGPRRVGKTYLAHHAIQKLIVEGADPRRLCYIAVDHPLYNGKGLDELLALYEAAAGVSYADEECLVVFDEIQYLRDWEVHLKALVDRYERPKFLASGSAAAALKLKSRESGAGRFTDFLLPPLSFYEFLSLRGELDLLEAEDSDGESYRAADIRELNRTFFEYLNYGGYPEVVLSDSIRADPSRFIKADIIDKVLLRDLPSLYGIQDIQELNSLFTTLAYNTAGELSLENLSKRSGVTKNTLKKYIEYLEAAFLVRVVHRVDRDAKRFKRATHFKVYLTNPSIRTALFSPIGVDDSEVGAMVETALFAQWFHTEQDIHYARWKGGEVDMVYMDSGSGPLWALDVKWSDTEHERGGSMAGLREFCTRTGVAEAHMTTKSVRFSRQVGDLVLEGSPSAELCFNVGRNLIHVRP